ncbi:phage GP46 family protein, partial [Pseudomonas sp. DrBHI1]
MTLLDAESERAWQRAVVISLLTWRRAEAGDLLDDDQRYGWWGDTFP